MPHSYLVVGDVHGCVDELEDLIRVVRDPGRELVLVGDLVGKGPASHEVVACVQERGGRAVLGTTTIVPFVSIARRTRKAIARRSTASTRRTSPTSIPCRSRFTSRIRVSSSCTQVSFPASPSSDRAERTC